jgi:hypothetical protein
MSWTSAETFAVAGGKVWFEVRLLLYMRHALAFAFLFVFLPQW